MVCHRHVDNVVKITNLCYCRERASPSLSTHNTHTAITYCSVFGCIRLFTSINISDASSPPAWCQACDDTHICSPPLRHSVPVLFMCQPHAGTALAILWCLNAICQGWHTSGSRCPPPLFLSLSPVPLGGDGPVCATGHYSTYPPPLGHPGLPNLPLVNSRHQLAGQPSCW